MATVVRDMICETTHPRHHGTPPHTPPLGLKASLTPATMSSAESSPSFSSSFTPCHQSRGEGGMIVPQHQGERVRVPVPSPSRPRLDPRYAARLAPQILPPSETELMPPPGIHRSQTETSIFRPTPIISPFSSDSRSSSFSSTEPMTLQDRPNKRPKPEDDGDRFIPSRSTSNLNVSLWNGISQRVTAQRNASRDNSSRGGGDSSDDRNSGSSSSASDSSAAQAAAASSDTGSGSSSAPNSLNTFSSTTQQYLVNTLLRTEMLGENEYPAPTNNHLRFQSRREVFQENVFDQTGIVNSFSLTPVGSAASQRLMSAPPKRKRRISKVPFKVLDAPALADDFYLNLVDWSSQNVLAVGLGPCVYLWSACTSKVTKLCDLTSNEDTVTAVCWAQRGTHLSVGTNKGEVQLWDTIKCKKVRSMNGHSARAGTLAFSGPILASGSRDRHIYLRDVRVQAHFTDKLSNHRQEVCGLKWSFEEPSFLASGGNDNNLHVIDSRNPNEPLHKFTEHTAAVKAIAWSPHQHGLLASGGGTADRCIRFWNTLSGSSLNKIDTGSQVCNLAWSQNCNEIVSTHGYSLNQIVVWRYPSMSKVTTLTGHTYRVLYLAMSPDGSTVVTGAGDETLRFWQIFPGPRSDGKDSAGGLLFPNTLGSVIR